MSLGSVGRIRSISSRSRRCDLDLIGADERPYPKVDAFRPVVLRDEVGLFGPQLDPGHVAEPHDGAAAIGDDQVREFINRAQVRVGHEVDLHLISLGLADGGKVVVALERRLHVTGREVECGQAIGVDPDAHGDLAPALVVGHALNALDRRKLRLHGAKQVIGDRWHAALGRVETKVERRIRPIGSLHLDHRRLGFHRQFRADLLEPRGDLGQRLRAIVVQL